MGRVRQWHVRPGPAPLVAQGGRRGWITALIAAAILGGGTLVVPALLSRRDALGFLAILLGAIGAVYIGFVLADGRASEFGIEGAGILLFGALATAGLALSARGAGRRLPGARLMGQPVQPTRHPHRMPRWYVPRASALTSLAASTC